MSVVWVSDEASYRDLIEYVMTYAPDRFPVEDYLAADEQFNLERAFSELRDGLKHASLLKRNPDRSRQAAEMLEKAYQAYLRADRRRALEVLQEFEVLLGYDLKSRLRRN